MSVATPIRPNVATSALSPIAATEPVAPLFLPSATVPARAGESPAALRDRLLRAAGRLILVLDAGGHVPARWVLRLERDGGATAMPLPAAAIGGDPAVFARRIPDAALRGVERLILDVSLRNGRQSHTLPVASAVA